MDITINIFDDNERPSKYLRDDLALTTERRGFRLSIGEPILTTVSFQNYAVIARTAAIDLRGPCVIFLDLNYELSKIPEARQVLDTYDLATRSWNPDHVYDGIAIGELLARNVNLTKAVVVVGTAVGSSGNISKYLNRIAESIGRESDILFTSVKGGTGIADLTYEEFIDELDEALITFSDTFQDPRALRLECLAGVAIGTGARENEELDEEFFVETQSFQGILADDVDIVYGSKGTGKSTIYAALLSRSDVFRTEGILVVDGGTMDVIEFVKEVAGQLPEGERLTAIWKVCLLLLITDALRFQGFPASEVEDYLRRRGFLEKTWTGRIREYLRGIKFRFKLDPNAPVPVPEIEVGGDHQLESKTVDSQLATQFKSLDDVLVRRGLTVWVLLDRLDVAFDGDAKAESAIVGALMQTYTDLLTTRGLRFRIFLRDDIWTRILRDRPVRNRDHITRESVLAWGVEDIRELVGRRLLTSDALRVRYSARRTDNRWEFVERERVFRAVFGDERVEPMVGLDYFVKKLTNNRGEVIPRSVVLFLSKAVTTQIHLLKGSNPTTATQLLEKHVLSDAASSAAYRHVTRTLAATWPFLSTHWESLRSKFIGPILANETADEICKLCSTTIDDLVEAGLISVDSRGGYTVAPILREAANHKI